MSADFQILVVDDDRLVREYIERALQRLGYACVTTSSGADALKLLERQPCVRMLITDLKLGAEMEGAELMRQALAEWPDLEVLLLSGDPFALDDARPTDCANVSLLAKPFRRRDLAKRLKCLEAAI